jgi:AraC-like DNA-binding protein
VAQRCGFASQTHFGVLFKKRFGTQPSKMTRNRDSESQTRELATD